MSISSGLQLAQLNDYLQPSTACVQPNEIQTELSLDDCLACSGCITSAESMLVNMQTDEQLLDQIKAKDEIFCILSTQSVLAVAKHFQLEVQETWMKLNVFMQTHLNAKVKDINEGRMLSLVLTAEELIDKSKSNNPLSSIHSKGNTKLDANQLSKHFANSQIPMFVTACPGWVCYAEKTHPFLLPLLSSTKSPQQLSGVLCKHMYASNSTNSYVFCVMPCYDKKLEASRPHHATNNIKDVDLVLTTAELIKLMEKKKVDFKSIPTASTSVPALQRTMGMGSGGYSEFVFLYVLKKVFSIPIYQIESTVYNQYTINITHKRGSDLREFELIENDKVVFKVVAAFGFKHIQNIVRQLKRKGQSDCHFYEVMACPGGCLNGGGQVNIVGSSTKLLPSESKKWIMEMKLEYENLMIEDVLKRKYALINDNLLKTEFMTIQEREVTAVNVVNSW